MAEHTKPCPHCQAALPEEAFFCPYCAQSVRHRETVTPPFHLWRKIAIWAAVLVILSAGGTLFYVLHQKAPGLPTGETVSIILEEDENGYCKVTQDLLQQYFPAMTYLNFDTTAVTSDNIDDYLKENFQMAALVASRGTTSSANEWSMFSARNNPDIRLCLLLFDSSTHLMGYFIGEPLHVGESQWQLDVIQCDYDFTQLYEEELAAFEGQWQETFATYIPPEDVAWSGAVWFLSGYDTAMGPQLRVDDPQLYHLWTLLHSLEPERQCREIQRLKEFLPSEGRWRCYLLLDGDYQLLGYTMLDSTGSGLDEPANAF